MVLDPWLRTYVCVCVCVCTYIRMYVCVLIPTYVFLTDLYRSPSGCGRITVVYVHTYVRTYVFQSEYQFKGIVFD